MVQSYPVSSVSSICSPRTCPYRAYRADSATTKPTHNTYPTWGPHFRTAGTVLHATRVPTMARPPNRR